ncbi:PREDICTED: alkane hydroxylase MAH1-like [Ipomoea nil]|uniref:alkane hydroxylase MAH1-like n=1 Tax=Ipomoea nil TaxID=35883 RepID=UPI0009011687|nr:PREDICTED: alkane hydroxylase MAH1-like [Ipomoea nil]
MSILNEFGGVVLLSVVVLCGLVIWKKRNSRSFAPTNWPVLGMLPGIVQNAHRFLDYATELLRHNGGTIEIKGPWFANSTFMLLTCDPANINHILCKNFNNYPKGPHFNKIFQILGDGIINTDSHLWELHRKTTMPLMNHPNFRASLERNVLHKMENGLFPALDHYVQLGTCFDLQQLFQRVGFDISCQQFLDKDPGCLSVESLGGGD